MSSTFIVVESCTTVTREVIIAVGYITLILGLSIFSWPCVARFDLQLTIHMQT